MHKPVFVVDAYTKRIFIRKGVFLEGVSYDDVQRYFEGMIAPDVPLYNEFHAQIVNLGKDFCKKKDPRCDQCPIKGL